MAGLIRTTHPYGFRSGQWAKLRGTIGIPQVRRTIADYLGSLGVLGTSRPCYVVEFDDGVIDWWVIDDKDGRYEFA